MMELLTILEHDEICISQERDLKNLVISEEDRNLLFDVVYKDKKGNERYIFSHKGKNKIKAGSIVGSISLKNGLTIEILPKFAKASLTTETKKRYRKTLINMIRVSKEKNFITSYSQSSKISMGEMPLISFVIELFTVNLLENLRQGIYVNYSKCISNSSYIRGNVLVSKTIQNNFIDKSKIYTSYNKRSSNNFLMQIFKSLSKLLLEDKNLSYRTRQNLHEIYLILSDVETINLKSEYFQKIIFNRLNDKYEVLFNQASFIYSKYMPFSSKINATPFWSILFDMDYLFEKFVAYLFRMSNIEFIEQNTTRCFMDSNDIKVSAKPDFIIQSDINLYDKKITNVIDAKWKLLSDEKSLYGLNTQNFWQVFSYMNLINEDEEIHGYFIVPKNTKVSKFKDEIEFKPIINGKKSISIISIDFSLDFESIIKKHKYKIHNNKLELDYVIDNKTIPTKHVYLKKRETIFDFKVFIDELEILSKDNSLIEILIKNHKGNSQFKNIISFKNIQKIDAYPFKKFIENNLKIKELILDNFGIKYIPSNILKIKNLLNLNLDNNSIVSIPQEFFLLKKLKKLSIENNNLSLIDSYIKELTELTTLMISGNVNLKISSEILNLKNLKQIVVDGNIKEINIDIFQKLIKNGVKLLDKKELEDLIMCTNCYLYKKKEDFKRPRHKKTNYKTGICTDCENLNTQRRNRTLDAIITDRFKTLNKKAKKQNKNLEFTRKEFIDKFKNNTKVKELYEIWKLNEDKDLKLNFDFINEDIDYTIDNISISTTKEILIKHSENLINSEVLSKPVVQFSEEGNIVKIYPSMQEAERQNPEFHNGGICNCCKENHKRINGEKQRKHHGYIWKYKSDVNKKLIENFESKKDKNYSANTSLNSQNNDKAIKELLIELKENEINKKFDINDEKCILSEKMIEQFIRHKPVNIDEFKMRIPLDLRENIDINQMVFIEKIFEIIEMCDL